MNKKNSDKKPKIDYDIMKKSIKKKKIILKTGKIVKK